VKGEREKTLPPLWGGLGRGKKGKKNLIQLSKISKLTA